MDHSTTPAERLRIARTLAGYPNAKAFASQHDIPQPTYFMHEKGDRLLRPHVASRYARLLNVSEAWLLTGQGDGPDAEAAPHSRKSSTIHEVDVRAEAGAGGIGSDLSESSETVVERWVVPTGLLRAHTTAGHEHLRIIRVYGDSMLPVFRPGDRLLVDTSDRLPSPPGIFVLWDGLGIVVKRLEFVPYSDPATIRLISDNTSYETYSRALSEITINGRVIGRWDWT